MLSSTTRAAIDRSGRPGNPSHDIAESRFGRPAVEVNTELNECRGLLLGVRSLYANANNSKGFYRLEIRPGMISSMR